MQENPLLKVLLLPLGFMYGIGIYIRNALFDSGILTAAEFNTPIVSIGNLTVGGTGKTPVTEYLAELLGEKHQVAVLSRGYKRKTRGFVLASPDATPREIGDEPCQIKARYPDTIVAVAESRVEGVRKLLQLHPEMDVVILDDAYQHRYIKSGLSILLIDYNRPVAKDWLLPVGRLREPASGIKRANIILITKCPENLSAIERRIMVQDMKLPPYQHLFFTSIEYGNLMSVFKEYSPPDSESLKKENPEIILLTGIANPKPFKQFAHSISAKITEMAYPDHHDFNEEDIRKITEKFNSILTQQKIVLTTWKDAVRLKELEHMPEEIKKVLFFVPIKINFFNNDHHNFSKLILNYVSGDKRNSSLYKGKNEI